MTEAEPRPLAPPLPAPRPQGLGLWQSIGELLLIVLLSIVTFWKSLSVPFLAGDYDWLSIGKYGQQEYYGALRQPHHLYGSFSGDVFRWMYGLFGDGSAFEYRLTLLTIHVVNTFLAGKLVARILGRPGTAWIAAAIFAIAPASGEVVHSIAAFVYLIVAFLLIVGLTFYDRAVATGKVWPWAAAMVCFSLAVPFKPHAFAAFPLAILFELLRGNGFKAFKKKGPWLRLLTPIAAGLAVWAVRGWDPDLRIPPDPDYRLTVSMGERLLVTLQRLVLPPVPVSFHEYGFVHKLIGVAFLAGALVMILTAPRGDRRRGMMLLLAVIVSLTPFLPVDGDHVRRRFAYFGTVFAAGLVAFMVTVIAERVSPRVTLPLVLAILAGLLLEQQAEFERDYVAQSLESKYRADVYRDAAKLVASSDDIAVIAGDPDPNPVTARSTLRVVSGFERKQLLLVKAASGPDLVAKIAQVQELTGARGKVHFYIRGAVGYFHSALNEVELGSQRIFESDTRTTDRAVFVMTPRAQGEVK